MLSMRVSLSFRARDVSQTSWYLFCVFSKCFVPKESGSSLTMLSDDQLSSRWQSYDADGSGQEMTVSPIFCHMYVDCRIYIIDMWWRWPMAPSEIYLRHHLDVILPFFSFSDYVVSLGALWPRDALQCTGLTLSLSVNCISQILKMHFRDILARFISEILSYRHLSRCPWAEDDPEMHWWSDLG